MLFLVIGGFFCFEVEEILGCEEFEINFVLNDFFVDLVGGVNWSCLLIIGKCFFLVVWGFLFCLEFGFVL